MRQPNEDMVVTISRAQGLLALPATVLLVVVMNSRRGRYGAFSDQGSWVSA